MTVRLVNHADDNSQTFDSRKEAEETKQDMMQLGVPEGDLEIIMDASGGRPEPDDGATVVDEEQTQQESAQPPEPVSESKPALDDDPVDWMPSHFVDNIQGVPTLNRKGYAVMAERFNVSVTSESVVRASETDFEYAEFRATAETEDGTEYSGFGSAHVERGDGDDEYLLNELAQTRAMKRAASWALGLGMTAKEEMENTL